MAGQDSEAGALWPRLRPGMVDEMNLVRLLRRIAVTVVGTVILAVGVVLLVAPGPGLLVILLALIVFAVEYDWARHRLAAVRARARSAADKAAASRVATASAVLFGIGAIGLGAVLIFTDFLPLSGVATGASIALGGLTVLATTAYSIREMPARPEGRWGLGGSRRSGLAGAGARRPGGQARRARPSQSPPSRTPGRV